MPDPPASAERVSNEALYRALRERIIHLELAPGARLTEQAIAAEFGVSRTPVRRVLDRLANDGLVTIRAGSGASVSSIDFQELREVWALRLRIADLVGDFVRLPASPEVNDRLVASLAGLDEVETAAELAPRYDEYHEIMLELLTNGPLRKIYDQLYAQTARAFVQMLPSLDLDLELTSIRDEIERTIEACKHRSGHALSEVRRDHMERVIDRINQALMIARPSAVSSWVGPESHRSPEPPAAP
ncbi:MAG: GntR family transcriptional regulator [Acidimicrobiales bacterium]